MDTTFCAPGLLSPSSVLLKACSWQGPQSARFDDTRKSRFKQPRCCDNFVKFCQLGTALWHFESFWYTWENGGALGMGLITKVTIPPKKLIIFPMRFWTLRLRHLSTYRLIAPWQAMQCPTVSACYTTTDMLEVTCLDSTFESMIFRLSKGGIWIRSLELSQVVSCCESWIFTLWVSSYVSTCRHKFV